MHGYLDRDALRRAESRPDSARERLLQGLCSFSGRAHRPGAAIAAASCRIAQSMGAGSESWARGRHSRRRAYSAAIAAASCPSHHDTDSWPPSTRGGSPCRTRLRGRRVWGCRHGAGAWEDADTGQARRRIGGYRRGFSARQDRLGRRRRGGASSGATARRGLEHCAPVPAGRQAGT